MRRLAALAAVALARPDLSMLLQEITEIVKKLLPATQASLIMWDPDREEVDLSASTMPAQRPRDFLDEVRDSGGATRWIIDHRQPLAMPNIEDDPFGASPMLLDAGLRAYLGVPVLFEDETLGVLYALDSAPRQYTKPDMDFMTILASRASTAIGLARLFEQVQELARTDELTGVLNRREFFRRANAEFERERRTAEPISALVIDLDHFKDVNDRHGHSVGDHVLSDVACRCARVLRAIDIFGRIGGEEFAVLLPDTDEAGALLVAERLRAAVGVSPIETTSGPILVSVTIGVADRGAENEDVTTLLNLADKAMYCGKAAGRDRVATNEP